MDITKSTHSTIRMNEPKYTFGKCSLPIWCPYVRFTCVAELYLQLLLQEMQAQGYTVFVVKGELPRVSSSEAFTGIPAPNLVRGSLIRFVPFDFITVLRAVRTKVLFLRSHQDLSCRIFVACFYFVDCSAHMGKLPR